MDRRFLSPAASGETRSEHGSSRSEAPDGHKPGDLFPDVFSPTEMSAPVASTPASVHSASRERAGVRASVTYREELIRQKRSSCRGEEDGVRELTSCISVGYSDGSIGLHTAKKHCIIYHLYSQLNHL